MTFEETLVVAHVCWDRARKKSCVNASKCRYLPGIGIEFGPEKKF
jgi:hypothetical protein